MSVQLRVLPLVYSRDVLLPSLSSLADRTELLLKHTIQELLDLYIAKSTAFVVLFHLVEVLVIRPELCEVFVLAECVQICEDGISLNLSRIAYLCTWT